MSAAFDQFLSSASMNLKSFSIASGMGIVPASYLAILKQRRLDCPYVFHRNGKQIKDYRDAWATACKDSSLVAGRAGVTPHDLRRCAARNLSRAGVPEQIAMRITGHKTASMYRRYRIVDERDLREATQSLNAYLETQSTKTVVAPVKKASGE